MQTAVVVATLQFSISFATEKFFMQSVFLSLTLLRSVCRQLFNKKVQVGGKFEEDLIFITSKATLVSNVLLIEFSTFSKHPYF